MKIYGPKLEPRSKLGHENRRALEPENSAESEHYSLSLTPVIPVRLFSPGWNPTQPMHVSFNSDLKYVSQNKLTRR